jgi:osmoprotectant transport system substrate-binding protein
MSRRRASVAALVSVMLSVGLLVGLGTGSASAGHTDTATGTAVATIPEPVVTTVTAPTTTTQTLPGANRPAVALSDMNTPEQFIIGQLYQVALEQQGYKVVLYRNGGLLSVDLGALRNGSLAVFPEYLGVWNSSVAHLHRSFRTLRASFGAARVFARRNGYVLLKPTPFSDTNCVAVLAQYAQANDVHSIPELAHGEPIIFGAPLQFQSSGDGLPGLARSYGLHPDYVEPIADGLQYWWLRTANVEAAYCASTDPQLASTKYVQLRDPKQLFGHGNVIPVTTRHAMRAEGKVFTRTLERVDALLTLQAMRGLNAEYQLGRHDPAQIATQFLEGNGILPPARYAPVPTTTTAVTSTST